MTDSNHGGAAPWFELGAISVILFAIWCAALWEILGDYTVGSAMKGGLMDWLMVREGVLGIDAYAPVSDLAAKWLDLTEVTPDTPHPRPPSAIAALLPLGAVPPGSVIIVLAMVMAICVVLTVDQLVRWLALPSRSTWAIALVVGSTASITQGAAWGSHIPLVALCAVLFVVVPEGTRKSRGPAALGGVAVGLKLFPAFLLLTQAKAAPKRVLGAIFVFGLLTLIGLALPGVNLPGAWQAVSGASAAYSGGSIDMTVAAQLGIQGTHFVFLIPLFALALVPVLWKVGDRHDQVAMAFLLMLLASPIAWPEYQLLALPAALVLWKRSWVGRTASVIWLAVLALTIDGGIHLASVLVLSLTLVHENYRTRRRLSPSSQSLESNL